MSRTAEHALLAWWAYLFSGGLKWTFLATAEITEHYWPLIAAAFQHH